MPRARDVFSRHIGQSIVVDCRVGRNGLVEGPQHIAALAVVGDGDAGRLGRVGVLEARLRGLAEYQWTEGRNWLSEPWLAPS